MKNFNYSHRFWHYWLYIPASILLFIASCVVGDSNEELLGVVLSGDSTYPYVSAGTTNSRSFSYFSRPLTNNHGKADFYAIQHKSSIYGSGRASWHSCLGGSETDMAFDIQKCPDGGYILVGKTNSNDGDVVGNHGGFDVWVVKLNSQGWREWSKCYGGRLDDEARSIQLTSDGGYIFVGTTNSVDGDVSGNHGQTDIWVVKINNTGDVKWQKCFGGTKDETGYDIQVKPGTTNSGYIIASSTASDDGDAVGNHRVYNTDALIVNLDSSGNKIWSKCYGGTSADVANSIVCLPNNEFAFTGYSISNDGDVQGNHSASGYLYDIWTMKISATGDKLWQKCFGGEVSDFGQKIIYERTGTLIVIGNSGSQTGDVRRTSGLTTQSRAIALRISWNSGRIWATQNSFDSFLNERCNDAVEYEGRILGVGVLLRNNFSNPNSNRFDVDGAWEEEPLSDFTPEGFTQDDREATRIAMEKEQVLNGTTIEQINKSQSSEKTKSAIMIAYPNPSSGIVNIRINEGLIQNARLFSTSGAVVWSSQKIDNQSFTQDWSTLPKGIYLLHLATESGEKMQKIVLK